MPVVVNHCGGLLGIGPYAGADTSTAGSPWSSTWPDAQHAHEARRTVRAALRLRLRAARRAGTADELARTWKPYIETCIEAFGSDRCLYESNFPPDRVSGDYRTVWNALKLTAAGCSASEKAAMFSGTARRVYGIS